MTEYLGGPTLLVLIGECLISHLSFSRSFFFSFPLLLSGVRQSEQSKDPGCELPDNTVALRSEGNTVQLCGDSSVAGNKINDQWAMGKRYRERNIGGTHKTLHSWWKRSVAYPVKHVFREHNQKSDHLANLEAEGKSKITIEGVKNAET